MPTSFSFLPSFALPVLQICLKKCSFVNVDKKPNETYDDVVVRVATEWKCPVATNDKEMKKRLREKGVTTIFLRQKRRLAMEGTV
ncbi:MAG: hypothetical protein P8X84_04615 [Candidatus Bathyarchaeota archaeon]